MLRNHHFFTIKPGADTDRILSLMDNEFAAYAKTYGCIERKTWKQLDLHSWDRPADPAPNLGTYLNKALWPSQQEADAFSQAYSPEKAPAEIKALMEEIVNGVEF